MRKLFQHIRKQPKSVRDNYAMGFAAAFTGLVIIVWLISQPFENILSTNSNIAAGSKKTPFSTLIKETKAQFATVFSSVSNGNEDNSITETSDNAPNDDANAAEMIISDENIDLVQKNFDKSTSTELKSDIKNEEIVLIATTSTSRSVNLSEVSSSSSTSAIDR